jgi:hypothetical protein
LEIFEFEKRGIKHRIDLSLSIVANLEKKFFDKKEKKAPKWQKR